MLCVFECLNISVALMGYGFGPLMCRVLQRLVSVSADGAIAVKEFEEPVALYLHEMCLTMKGLCIHDDLRRDMSSAYDNGKFFLGSDNLY